MFAENFVNLCQPAMVIAGKENVCLTISGGSDEGMATFCTFHFFGFSLSLSLSVKTFLLTLLAIAALSSSMFPVTVEAQSDSSVVPCSTACPEQWEGPRFYPRPEDTTVWAAFWARLDTTFAQRYPDCRFQIIFYARKACGLYREVYIQSIRLSDGCDSLMNDIEAGRVKMSEFIDVITKHLIWLDAVSGGAVLGIDTLDIAQFPCSNGGYTYYRIYRATCGYWKLNAQTINKKRREEDPGTLAVGSPLPDIQSFPFLDTAARFPKWVYRKCNDDCCVDLWHACWYNGSSNPNIPSGPQVSKLSSSQGKMCWYDTGPDLETCYFNCQDTIQIEQGIIPRDPHEWEQITSVAEPNVQEARYYVVPSLQRLQIYLRFDTPEPFTVELYNLQGQQVFSVPEIALRKEHFLTLNLQGLSPGAYVLAIRGATFQLQRIIQLR